MKFIEDIKTMIQSKKSLKATNNALVLENTRLQKEIEHLQDKYLASETTNKELAIFILLTNKTNQ